MNAARKICGTGGLTIGVLRRRKRGGLPVVSDRLVEDARIFLLIIQRQWTSYDEAIEALVRDAFGSAARLRAAAAAARACARRTAEAVLLEQAADRVEHLPPLRVPGPRRT